MRPRRAAFALLATGCFLTLSLGAVVPPSAAAGASDAPLELMIAPDSFVAELLPLKAWREQQGLRVDIVTTTYVHAQMGGRDLPESIKAFLAAREATDPRLTYVLLAADDPIIPGRLLQVANRTAGAVTPDADRSLVSDFYYSAGGATFLNDSDLGDDYPAGPPWYGIEDSSWNLTARFHVGRIPAANTTELREYVGRLIAWEQNPPAGVWRSRAVLGLAVASVPDSSFGSRRLGDDAGVTFAAAESLLASGGFTNISLRDYPGWPAAYDPIADTLDDPTFLGEWSLGAFLVALAARDSPVIGGAGEAYAGDGSSADFVPIASPTSVDGLSNADKRPLYVAAYGGSANFSLPSPSGAERALLASGGGAALAVGFTGRTGAGTAPGGALGGWSLAAAAARELLERPGPIGAVLDAARNRFMDDAKAALGAAWDANNTSLRRAVAGLALLGDPASVPLLGPPKNLDVAFPPGVPPNSTTVIDVIASFGGVGLPDASVAILDEAGDLQAVGVTDAQGLARVSVSAGGRATWTVFVSAAGFARVSRPLAIDSPPSVVIITPGDNSSVAGQLNFTGVAGDPDAGDTVSAVELSLNGGAFVAALGTTSWSLAVDTTLLDNGPNTVAARASDGTVWSAPVSVTYRVTNAKPPSLLAPYGALTLAEDTTLLVALNLTDHFAASGPGALLSASAETADRLRVAVNGSFLSIVPEENVFGPATVTLRVFDSYGGSVSVSLSVMVVAVDDPPALTVALNHTVEEGGTVNFDPRAFDPDGTVPTIYLESGPPGSTATGWNTPRGALGAYELVIAASDGRFIIRATLVVTVVSHNSPPSARIAAPAAAEAGREVAFVAQDAADVDGDAISFEWDFGDGQSAQGAQAAHVFAAPGTYTVTLRLSDGRQTAEVTQAITIDPYRSPTAAPSTLAAALAYASLAVIALCAAAAAYLLFLSPRRRAFAISNSQDPTVRRTSDEDE